MTISSAWDLSSDAELITAVRSGESVAFGVLYERHAGAARAVARQYSNSAPDAEDAVADAFSKVFSAVRDGGGPDVAFRAYLFTVVRRVALNRVEGGKRAVLTDDLETFESAIGLGESTEEPTMAGFERGIVSHAYKSLPERWQAVLWYTEVEELSPAQIAPILGLTANGVAALAYRAREGLRQAYLQQHLAAPTSEACTIVNGKLGAYVRGGLAKRETALVEMHLEECGSCRALVLELGDVNHGMRVVIAPLVLGFAAIGVLKGLGFGGVAGAVGVGAGAGSGVAAGSSTTTGVTTAAGSGAGSASLVGSGVGMSGVAVAGTGATMLVGAQASGAVTASAMTLVSSGSAAGTGGGAAGLPFGFVAAAATGVLVAGAVAVAGFLGVFTPDGGAQPGSEVVAEESAGPDDADSAQDPAAGVDPAAPSADDPQDAQGSTGDPGTGGGTLADPSTSGPAVVPGTAPLTTPAPTGTAPGTATTPVTPATPSTATNPGTPTTPVAPSTPPVPPSTPPPPPVVPPAPAALEVGSLAGLSFTAGVPEVVQVTVSNTGGTAAGEVRSEFVFPVGVAFEIVELGAMPSGGGLARTAVPSADWTCTSTANVGACTLPALAPGETSTLIASVVVRDDALDGEAQLPIEVVTWIPAAGPRPPATTLLTRVASTPAVVTIAQPDPVAVVGSMTEADPVVVPVQLTNSGGTTARNVPVTVAIPDLPAGFSVIGGDGCTPAPGGLACVVAEIPKGGAPASLVLNLTASTTLRDVEERVDIRVTGPSGEAVLPVTISSAPAEIVTSAGTGGLLLGDVDDVVTSRLTFALANVGGTGHRSAVAHVLLPVLPDGVTAVASGDGWTCDPLGVDDWSCSRAVLAADASSDPITVVLTAAAPDLASDPATGFVNIADSVRITLDLPSAPATPAVSATVRLQSAPGDLELDAPDVVLTRGDVEPVTLEVKNAGATDIAVGPVTVDAQGRVPSMRYRGLPAASPWSCVDVGSSTNVALTCTLVAGELAAGRSADLQILVEVNASVSRHAEVTFDVAGSPPRRLTAGIAVY